MYIDTFTCVYKDCNYHFPPFSKYFENFCNVNLKTKALQFRVKTLYSKKSLSVQHYLLSTLPRIVSRFLQKFKDAKFFLIFWQIKIKEFTLKIIFLTSKKVIFGAYLKALRKFAKGNTLDYIKISLSVIKQLRG